MQLDLTLTEPQDDFVFHEATYPLFVGGFGSGKSEALFKRTIIQKLKYRFYGLDNAL
jgi:phage terminase large subunit